jgi:hypothetical protein
MSLWNSPIELTKFGTVTVTPAGITVEGFEGNDMSCREVAVLACMWAIGELQRETTKTIERPGGGAIAIG